MIIATVEADEKDPEAVKATFMQELATRRKWKDWKEVSLLSLSSDVAQILFPISHCVRDIIGKGRLQSMDDKDKKRSFSFYDTRTLKTRRSFAMALVEAIQERVVKVAAHSGITY